jgi:hypothetical protein
MFTTVHASTASQHLLDGFSKKDVRQGEGSASPSHRNIADLMQADLRLPTSFQVVPTQPQRSLRFSPNWLENSTVRLLFLFSNQTSRLNNPRHIDTCARDQCIPHRSQRHVEHARRLESTALRCSPRRSRPITHDRQRRIYPPSRVVWHPVGQ